MTTAIATTTATIMTTTWHKDKTEIRRQIRNKKMPQYGIKSSQLKAQTKYTHTHTYTHMHANTWNKIKSNKIVNQMNTFA